MELNQAYEAYQKEPSAQTLRPVVEGLQPTIDYSLQSINAGGDPHMKNMARVYAARAVEKYDPQYGASLKTWVSNQLQQLKRLRRQTQQVLKVPERIQLDGMHLENSRRDFQDKHGREPDVGELAEASKIPVERIKRVREYNAKVGVDAEDMHSPTYAETDYLPEAMEYVYMDSDHIDRKIMEHRLGYGGASIWDGKKLTHELALTDPQLSRRAARIAKKLLDVQNQLEAVT